MNMEVEKVTEQVGQVELSEIEDTSTPIVLSDPNEGERSVNPYSRHALTESSFRSNAGRLMKSLRSNIDIVLAKTAKYQPHQGTREMARRQRQAATNR